MGNEGQLMIVLSQPARLLGTYQSSMATSLLTPMKPNAEKGWKIFQDLGVEKAYLRNNIESPYAVRRLSQDKSAISKGEKIQAPQRGNQLISHMRGKS